MAGWPLNKGTEYYKLAAGKAKEVIDGVENHIYNYALLDEYSQVYSWEYNNKNKELLLGIYYNRDQTNQAAPLTDFLQDMAQGGWGDTNGEINGVIELRSTYSTFHRFHENRCNHFGGIASRARDMFRMYRYKDHFEYRKENPLPVTYLI